MRSEKDIEELDQLQLLRSGIEYGMSLWSKDHSRRQTRCVTNQCLTGTINIHSLWHFLGVTESQVQMTLDPNHNSGEQNELCPDLQKYNYIYKNMSIFTEICLY